MNHIEIFFQPVKILEHFIEYIEFGLFWKHEFKTDQEFGHVDLYIHDSFFFHLIFLVEKKIVNFLFIEDLLLNQIEKTLISRNSKNIIFMS